MEHIWYYIFLILATVFIIFYRDADLSIKKSREYLAPLDINIHSILSQHFHYYKMLKPIERKRFVFRVKKFVVHKTFKGKDGLEITDDIRVLIAASAVQLTFGFAPIILKYFNTIFVYPKKYYSPVTKHNHVGEVSTKGIIKLSWPDFMKTLLVPNNAMNLGLHEMSHALKLENAIKNGEYGFLSSILLGRLHKLSIIEMRKIRKGENQFIRKYAIFYSQLMHLGLRWSLNLRHAFLAIGLSKPVGIS